MIPQSVIIGIIVAIVGYVLQQRAWKHKLYEDTRQREFEECLKLIDLLSRAIDKRLMAISVFHGEVEKGIANKEDLSTYRDSIKEWMHEFSSFKSKIYHYFGRDHMLVFENEVHAQLREVSDIVLRTHKFGKGRLSTKDRKEYESARQLMDFARHTAFRFLRELNEKLSDGEVGRTALYNNIAVGHLDLISRTYLIQRLLGLKS
ncbi:MAG: hypothetical protein J0L76_17160 [Rhodobacterales bacterium]|nr:hypothetical protein [Rhodobacterales bacterium]